MQFIIDFVLSLFKQAENIPHNIFPNHNNGVIDEKRDTDYLEGTLPFEVRNPSGDWRAFLPADNETQHSSSTDFMDCVSFSLTNSLEIQARKISNQNFNWSDRFLGKMSGTTKQGNFQYKVADTVRQYGLVNENEWPMPPNANWDSYYADIPADLVAKGKTEFPFTIAYEWIGTDKPSLLKALQHAPVQITIPGSNPVHAVCLVAIVGDVYYYYDSYAPFLKSMSTPPASALKVVLYDNRIIIRPVGWNDTEKGVYVGFDTSDRQAKFVAALQTLFPDYRLDNKEYNLGKRPW